MKTYITASILMVCLLCSYFLYTQGAFSKSALPTDDEQVGIEKQITIKFSHVVAENTPKGQSAQKFAQIVAQKSDGRIKVELYPNAILYNDKNEVEALQNNDVQLIAPTFSKMTSYVQALGILDLPYLFTSFEDAQTVLNGSIGDSLLQQLQTKQMKGLSFWHNGFKQMISEKEIHTLNDFSNQTMRVMQSNTLISQMDLLGAKAAAISFEEVYTDLKAQKITGQENTLSNIYSKGFYTSEPNITMSHHGYLGYAVIMNETFWHSLTDKDQLILTEAMAEATKWNYDVAKKMDQQSYMYLKEADVQFIHLNETEKTAWQTALQPLYTKVEKSNSYSLLETIEKTVQQNKQ